MGKTSGELPVGNQVSSPLFIFPGIVVTKDGLTFRIITMVTHFHQKKGHIED